MEILKAVVNDVADIKTLILQENDQNISEQYLQDWYWHNPFNSSSVILCKKEGQLKGMASTNNFKMKIAGSSVLVAFPQKVLTSKEIRGKGFFTKLYFENEKDNISSEGVDLFLTFTNQMSTPIFLNKFGYKAGICPDTILLPAWAFFMTGRGAKMKIKEHFDDSFLEDLDSTDHDNCVLKDPSYLNWRYNLSSSTKNHSYVKIEVTRNGVILGYAVVKKMVKKGIPMLVIADILVNKKENVADVLRQAGYYATIKGCLVLTLLSNEICRPAVDNIKLKAIKSNALNFLVKGKTEEETNQLTKTHFNFSFGDLDFI